MRGFVGRNFLRCAGRAAANGLLRGRLIAFAGSANGAGLLSGICGGVAGDQAGSAAEGQIFKSPLNEDHYAVLKFHDVDEMDEEPGEPGDES